MKQYKLIKSYLGCPYKLDQVIETEFIWVNSKKVYLKDYPENWQEVIEKDYEILTLITNVQGRISDFSNADPDYLAAMLKDKENVKIHSVKRLSDSEVFTIGDKINNKYIIDGFKISCWSNDILVYLDKNSSNGGWLSLKNISHSKKPLFTTEDGVDMFEGDNIWIVRDFKIEGDVALKSAGKYHSFLTIFSTKEAAEEYIIFNKPCLSLNDLKSLGIFNETDYQIRMWESIKELVKSKL